MPHALLQDIFERFRTQGFGLAPAIRKNIHFGDPGIADDLKDMGFMARGVGPKLWVSRRWHQSLNEQPVHGGPRGGSTSSSWWGIDLTKSKHHRQKTRNIEEIGGMGKANGDQQTPPLNGGGIILGGFAHMETRTVFSTSGNLEL